MSLFVSLQKNLPQHGVSRLIGRLGTSDNRWLKQSFINGFAAAYEVDMSEAANSDLTSYATFNDFFTRPLREGARPIADSDHGVVSPADGVVSQLGDIDGDQLLQAKGHTYSLGSLAGALGAGFDGGRFVTVYLAPSDYHRVHIPAGGRLTDTLSIPGALFSVNGTTEAGIPGLFCRNERLVCRFETPHGPMLVVLVGAMIVASIETVWEGARSPYRSETRQTWAAEDAPTFDTGDEIGRFLLGSTVICCFPPNSMTLEPDWQVGHRVRMGERMGEWVGEWSGG